MKTGLLACLQHEKVDCPECLPGPYVPATLRTPDRFELEREAYQRGFQAGADAARKEDAGIAATLAGEHLECDCLAPADIAEKILSRVGQPVEPKG